MNWLDMEDMLFVETWMSADPKLREWNELRDQFHALAREGSDSIEDIFDVQFRRRFSELISQTAERENRTDPDA